MRTSLACFAGLVFGTQLASSTPIDLAVIVGGVTYLRSTAPGVWPATGLPAGGGYTVTSPDLAGNIWLYTPPTFGLTDTTFTCSNPTGCTDLQFGFILLGESIADLATVDVKLSGNAAGASWNAEYFVAASGAIPITVSAPHGGPFPVSAGFTVGGTVGLLPLVASASGIVNYQIIWNLKPSGTVPFGASLSLPGSLDVTEVPEPATGLLAGLALAGVFAFRRYSRAK